MNVRIGNEPVHATDAAIGPLLQLLVEASNVVPVCEAPVNAALAESLVSKLSPALAAKIYPSLACSVTPAPSWPAPLPVQML